LSERGELDARSVSPWWRDRRIDWVISSPVLRSMATARLALGRIDDVDAGWGEQAMPALAGMSVGEAFTSFPELIRPDGWSRTDAPRNAAIEHIDTVADRAVDAMRRAAAQRPPGSQVAVVTHGAVLVALLRKAEADVATVANLAVGEFHVDPHRGWFLSAVHDPLATSEVPEPNGES
jgi:broad specificity phosphatase PhoE